MQHFFIKNKNTKRGFTLIEMMIAIALFSIIMVIGVGAVLNANAAHKKTQNVRAILDNLSFVMEDMSRNIRTGTDYHCDTLGGSSNLEDPQNCKLSSSLVFESVAGKPGDSTDQWQYFIACSGSFQTGCRVWKSTASGTAAPIALTPALPAMEIDYRLSGFTVVGACSSNPPTGQTCVSDTMQPKVIIRLSGLVSYQNTQTPFNLQTTVSQRVYDN